MERLRRGPAKQEREQLFGAAVSLLEEKKRLAQSRITCSQRLTKAFEGPFSPSVISIIPLEVGYQRPCVHTITVSMSRSRGDAVHWRLNRADRHSRYHKDLGSNRKGTDWAKHACDAPLGATQPSRARTAQGSYLTSGQRPPVFLLVHRAVELSACSRLEPYLLSVEHAIRFPPVPSSPTQYWSWA